MGRWKGLGKKRGTCGIFGVDDLRDCKDVEVIVGRVVRDIPGSVEDGEKGFGLKNLDALDIDWLS